MLSWFNWRFNWLLFSWLKNQCCIVVCSHYQLTYAFFCPHCCYVAFHKVIEYPVTFQVEKEQNKILRKVEDLKRQRDACHEKLGDIKTLTSFVMQAVRFWEEVGMLTNAATIKTEQLQILMDLATEENTDRERFLSSKGLQTKITSNSKNAGWKWQRWLLQKRKTWL